MKAPPSGSSSRRWLPIRVKGREQPVGVFRPLQLSASRPSAIVGRVQERRALRERLEALVAGARGGVVVLEGDAGHWQEPSRRRSHRAGRSRAACGRSWRPATRSSDRRPIIPGPQVFDNLLGFDDVAGRAGLERRVLELLGSEARLLPFAPLLNPVLRLSLPETEWSERVPPRGRAAPDARPARSPVPVHHAPSLDASRPGRRALVRLRVLGAGARASQRELPEILLLIATRSVTQAEKPPELVSLSARQDALVLRLDGLAPDETRALV